MSSATPSKNYSIASSIKAENYCGRAYRSRWPHRPCTHQFRDQANSPGWRWWVAGRRIFEEGLLLVSQSATAWAIAAQHCLPVWRGISHCSPGFHLLATLAEGTIVAYIVDPHGIHLADTRPKLKDWPCTLRHTLRLIAVVNPLLR